MNILFAIYIENTKQKPSTVIRTHLLIDISNMPSCIL